MPGINGSSNCPTCGSGYCHILGENPQVGTNGKLGIRVREDCDQIFFSIPLRSLARRHDSSIGDLFASNKWIQRVRAQTKSHVSRGAVH